MSLLYLTYKHFFHVTSLKQNFMAVASLLLSFRSIVCLVPRVGGLEGGVGCLPLVLLTHLGTHDHAVWMDCWASWDCPLPFPGD